MGLLLSGCPGIQEESLMEIKTPPESTHFKAKNLSSDPIELERRESRSVSTVSGVDSATLEYPGTGDLAYQEGQLFTGLSVSYYPNGQQATEVSFVNGMRDGVESRWFEDGIKKFEGRFQKNHLVGVFEEWYQNGQPKSRTVWQDGMRQSLTEWDENGNFLRNDHSGR